MPVMKQFRIGSATYDTVGEASVTQVQTSGTKIATVTIDGTATDLYAPEGGGDVSMTEEEVDAAVRAAWPVYTITNNASSYATVDVTSAGEYETVTVTVTSLSGILQVDVSGQNGMFEYFDTVGTHTFTMPASNVTLTANTGGGSN